MIDSMRRFLIPSIALALIAAACSAGEPTSTNTPRPTSLSPCQAPGVISEGEAVPACSFEGMEGFEDVSIEGILGKPMVLNFWASWCVLCIREMPEFQAVYEDVKDEVTFVGLDVVGIQAETKTAAEAFRKSTGAAYRMVFDPDGAFYARFQPNVLRPVMPITIFADADGVVIEKKFGPVTEQQLRDKLLEHFGTTA